MKNPALGAAALIVGGLLAASRAEGPVASPSGTKAVLKYATPLRVGSQVGRPEGELRIYTVERVDGDWRWLVAGSVSGWARSDQVVPLDEAIGFFTHEIDANPGAALAAYLRRGAVRAELGERDAALADFNEAVRRDPKSAAAHLGRGRIETEQGAHEKALADFNEALRLDPKSAAAFFRRGQLRSGLKQYDQAIADYTETIRLDPRDAWVYYDRANCWYDKHDYDQAIVDYTEAVRLDPRCSWAYHDRANCWYDRQDYDRAIADYTEAIRLDPRNAGAYEDRADAWSLKREYNKALAGYTEAIRLDPKRASAYLERSRMWRMKGLYDKAITDSTEAIRLDPRSSVAYWGRGLASFAREEYARAIADYTEAIRLAPREAFTYRYRGDAWFEADEPDKAVADYNESLRLDPRSAATFFNRGQARIDREQYEEAIADLERLPAQPRPSEGILIRAQVPAWDDGTLAGLPAGSHTEVLTWERAYTLALVHYRTPRAAGERDSAELLDPERLAEQGRRLGVADFARFRNDFCAGAGAGAPGNSAAHFIDPSGSLCDLLSRIQTLDNTWKFLGGLEQLKAVYLKLVATSGQAPRLDRVDGAIEQANRRYLRELQAYRRRLGEVRAALGLATDAPVVPDRTRLAKFRAVFDGAEQWARNPRRSLAELPRLVAQLPRMERVLLGQIAWEGVTEDDPKGLEGLLRAAEQAAIKNRRQGGLDDALRQQVRRRTTHLVALRNAYRREKQQWWLAIRTKDQIFEQMMAPPRPGDARPDIFAASQDLLESENTMVSLWFSFHAERLALARDLGLVPGRDWASFLARIEGDPASAQAPAGSSSAVPAGPPRTQ